ncbi:MAG: HlyC/CorC family transporter [Roseburia sp.]|nr:HlyC/CorC family transporter [Roseburia sp.]
MDDGVSPSQGLLIFALLILLDFVIFGFCAALRNLNDAAVEKMARDGSKKAALLQKYMDKSERYSQVCQLLALLAHMLHGFLQVPFWKDYFVGEAVNVYISAGCNVLIFAVLMILVLVFGVYTPEKVASRKPDTWAAILVQPVHMLEILFWPVIRLMDLLANLMARVFGVDPLSDTDDVTEEEIISMVKEGHEQGVLLASEAEMIHNIFEFGDKEAKDIMTHRKHIVALDGTMTFREAMSFISENSYSRFPVYLEDVDNIIGLLHIKDALSFSLEQSVFEKEIKDIDGLVRDVDFIPETRNINRLFAAMQADKSHMVIVVDEYGQTAGIVAMEDILEEIVGNIEDEHDEEEHMIELSSDGTYMMNGMADFSEVLETLAIETEEEDEDDFETLNGFLISRIDKIPNDNEVYSITAYGYLFEILSVESKRIQSVRVTKLPEQEAKSQTESGRSARSKEETSCQNEDVVV